MTLFVKVSFTPPYETLSAMAPNINKESCSFKDGSCLLSTELMTIDR